MKNESPNTIPVLAEDEPITPSHPRARYAKLNHKIYEAICRAYRNGLIENAVITDDADEKLLVQIARDYTRFVHEEQWEVPRK